MTNKGFVELNSTQIREKLANAKTIAVVGLSSKSDRPSYGVAEYMQRRGYKIYPVNPVETEVLGEKSYPDLQSLPVIPDIVDVFRRSDSVVPVVEDAIKKGAKFIWFQLGVVNLEAIEICKNNNIDTVVDKCLAVEHRYMGL